MDDWLYFVNKNWELSAILILSFGTGKKIRCQMGVG